MSDRESLRTKEHEITNKGPEVPVADPGIYAGIIGEITLEAALQ